MLIAYILRGTVPPLVADARRRKYYRDRWHTRPEDRAANAKRKRERYATDEAFREKCKADARARRAAMTPEQRAAEQQRRKERLAALPVEEYERRRALAAERTRKWRQKQKAAGK